MSNYDAIASSWYRLRNRTRFGVELEEMVRRWAGGRLLNIGCAHGPDFVPFHERFELWGLDSSEQMARLARDHAAKQGFEAHLTLGDAACLPFSDRSFDCAIAVAVYHHIQTEVGRDRAFRELKRVLKPGGEAFVTVWNRWQRRFWRSGKDVIVPWKTPDGDAPRYYYLYSYAELERKLKAAGLCVVRSFPESSYTKPFKYLSKNICVLVRAL